VIKEYDTPHVDFVEVRLDNGFYVSFDVDNDTTEYVENLISAAEEYLEWRKENGYE